MDRTYGAKERPQRVLEGKQLEEEVNATRSSPRGERDSLLQMLSSLCGSPWFMRTEGEENSEE